MAEVAEAVAATFGRDERISCTWLDIEDNDCFEGPKERYLLRVLTIETCDRSRDILDVTARS